MHHSITTSLLRVLITFMGMLSLLETAASSQDYASPSDIPAEAFAALPSFSSARISPNGERLAYFIEVDGHREVIIQKIDGTGALRIPPPEKSNFRNIRWANDNVILFRSGLSLKRIVFRTQSSETRWFSLDLTTQKFRWLGKPGKGDRFVSQNERIVDMLPDDPDHVLMELDFDLNAQAEVYRVNVRSGRRKTNKKERTGIQNWYTDNQSEVRLGDGYKNNEWTTVLKNADGRWVNLDKMDWSERFSVEGFSNSQDIIYVSGLSSKGTEGLFELNVQSGEITDSIFVHDRYDMDYAFEDADSGRIEGVVYTDDFTRVQYMDADRRKIQRSLEAAIPDSVITILNHVESKNWYLVLVETARNSGDYYIYDRPNGNLMFVSRIRPQIDPELMADAKPVSIPVRDGSEIPGYLIIPHSKPLENMPTIVLPHGGPYGVRDTAEWDYEAQFYASRGYLVLKPNFRGSGGYGRAFRAAGNLQWGGLMQDDVTDATKWLVNMGYSDPDRICIVGSSYGGYAALMGTIKEKGLYKCAISLNGVADLQRLKIVDKRNAVGGRSWVKRMGLEGVDDKDISPFHRADEVSAPVLLMAAVDDARVPWKMSRDMHKRLAKLDKPSTFVKIEEGTHHMVTAQSRLTALKAAEAFLAEHIGN